MLESLEPRTLFSGAPVEAPDEGGAEDSQEPATVEESIQPSSIGEETGSDPESGTEMVGGGGSLNAETLTAIAAAAKQRWIESGISAEQLAALNAVTYEIADLGGNHLGKANGLNITIDDDAAGTGAWFVDGTPDLDEEFSETGQALAGEAAIRVDLLTTLLHEQGHVLGLPDSDLPGLLADTLGIGQRRLPTQFEALLALPTSLAEGVHFLSFSQQAKLTASDAATEDNFGWSVAVDGDTAVIGAYGNDDAGGETGSAYIFTRSGATWTQQAKLIASDASSGDSFGYSVAVEGDTVVVGAYLHNGAGVGFDSGCAYVFTRSGGTWTQQAKLTATDATKGDSFGVSVAVDGDTAVVGAYLDDRDDTTTNSGSAYIFVRNGVNWT
ncbi:MAG: hypothetical protein KDL87_13870, partial [Verrucomicrobiae bacterium]|nr:hypothetical protein [Verrucomicrobiae bacterium]